MYTVTRDMTISAANQDSADACALAMENYMRRRSDVVPQVIKSLEHDPECAVAHATFGLLMHGAKHIALQPKVDAALEKARQFRSGISQREQLYIDALAFAADGQLYDSVGCYESILADFPTDGFALNLLQAELFWMGDMERALAASAKVESHWNESVEGYSEYLATFAFDLEEQGHFEKAESAGRKAVSMRPDNIWATHAVTHVLYMQNRVDEGIQWISELEGNWDELNQLQFHLWWHKNLFLLERQEHETILENYDSSIRNRAHKLVEAMPDLYIDLQNGASMLWRLELAGVNIGDRWQEMAELVKLRTQDHASPFTSAHFAVILAAVGDFTSCSNLIESMQDFATTSNKTVAQRYAKAGIPAAKAAIAHRQGHFQTVVDELLPVRHNLWMMGGSHAQQDLFFQMLVHAVAKVGDRTGVASLLNEIEKIGFIEPAQRIGYDIIAKELTL